MNVGSFSESQLDDGLLADTFYHPMRSIFYPCVDIVTKISSIEMPGVGRCDLAAAYWWFEDGEVELRYLMFSLNSPRCNEALIHTVLVIETSSATSYLLYLGPTSTIGRICEWNETSGMFISLLIGRRLQLYE